MSNLLLPLDKAQALIDYLAPRPYIEVAQLVADLMALELAPEPKRRRRRVLATVSSPDGGETIVHEGGK